MAAFKKYKDKIPMLIFSIIAISLVVSYFQDRKKDSLLEDNSDAFGILIYWHDATAIRSISYGIFRFSDNYQDIKVKIPGNYSELSIGDTILIEYANQDHSVVRVRDKYYMKKYQHLKNNQ